MGLADTWDKRDITGHVPLCPAADYGTGQTGTDRTAPPLGGVSLSRVPVQALQGVKQVKRQGTVWDLLVWAYHKQMVQYEVDKHCEYAGHERAARPFSMSSSWAERGCINGAGTTAHEDAHVIHAHVSELQPVAKALVIKTAARALPPRWHLSIAPLRVVPSRKGGSGNIRYLYSKSRNVIGCLIEYEGVPDDEAEAKREAARMVYSMWRDALACIFSSLQGVELERWELTKIGPPREPWKSDS